MRQVVRGVALGFVFVLLVAVGWLVYARSYHPSFEPYQRFVLRDTTAREDGEQVTVTFLGVTTLLITDGRTALLTDGFFTRPPLRRVVLGKIAPDPARIRAALERVDVTRLAAVIAVHSHYDHAMDSPEVASRTGALLVGSESTAHIGRGWGLPESQIRVARPGEPMRFGGFEVTLFLSRHFPHGMAMGDITAALVPPARATAYREGGSYSVLVRHAAGTLLVQGSAGYEEGALAGQQADVVFLGIAGLGGKDDAYRQAYFREVVEAVGARLVIPIHYDDFTLPLEPLRAMPPLVDDFDAAMRFLIRRVEGTPRMRLGMLPVQQRTRLLPAD